MEMKGSKTARNLMTAFTGESQARNRYTYFASKAKKEGFVQISDIFAEGGHQSVADNQIRTHLSSPFTIRCSVKNSYVIYVLTACWQMGYFRNSFLPHFPAV